MSIIDVGDTCACWKKPTVGTRGVVTIKLKMCQEKEVPIWVAARGFRAALGPTATASSGLLNVTVVFRPTGDTDADIWEMKANDYLHKLEDIFLR